MINDTSLLFHACVSQCLLKLSSYQRLPYYVDKVSKVTIQPIFFPSAIAIDVFVFNLRAEIPNDLFK